MSHDGPVVVSIEAGHPGPDTIPIQVDITPERVVCPRHGEIFREHWPDGFLPFSVHLFETLVNDEEFAAEVDGESERLHAALDESPICERVSRETLLGAYMLSNIGTIGECVNCKLVGSGTPFTYMTPKGNRRLDHLCFTCLVYRTVPMN